ncbi:MAG: HEAT repeat domain-containing protein [Chloroflexi bacterium]|nr:HEAT repeat domain-containing protein [Chloroflexota bacterium]
MFLDRYLEELQDESKPISSSKLINLSSLSRTELEPFRRAWGGIRVARRRKLVNLFGQLSHDNFDLDFSGVFYICLTDPDPEVRDATIANLGECEDRQLISPLINLLKHDPEPKVRASSAAALGKFALLAELGKLLDRDRDRLAQVFLESIEDANETPDVRRRALEGIAPLSHPKVKEHIRRAYNSPEPNMRASALYAMGRNCSAEWLPTIIRELKNLEPDIRREAVRACGEMGDPVVVPYLIPLTRDRDVQLQSDAIEALGNIGGGMARRTLKQLAQNEDGRIRDLALDALESMNMEEEPAGLQYHS